MRLVPLLPVAALALAVACQDDSPPPDGSQADAETSTGFVALSEAWVEGPARYHRRIGDLWMSTWADDDQLYMTFGDGIGRADCCVTLPADFTPSAQCDPIPASVDIVNIMDPSGTHPSVCSDAHSYCDCEATDFGLVVLGQAPGAEPVDCGARCLVGLHLPHGVPSLGFEDERDDKPSSILSVGGTLYLAGHSPLGDPLFGWIAFSEDHGLTWNETPDSPWQRPSPYRVLMFIQMGQDYTLNTDGYVYALAMGAEIGWIPLSGGRGEIYLARVPVDQIADYAAWEYLAGVDGGQPDWSEDPDRGVPVEGLASNLQGSAIFHPDTDSYLFIANNDPGGLYQAEHPWGPWTKVSDLFVPGQLPAGWLPDWGPLIGLIPMDTGPNRVHFTTASDLHYGLTIGTIGLR